MQEFDSSQNDTEFQSNSPNWAGGHSARGPESASHPNQLSHSGRSWSRYGVDQTALVHCTLVHVECRQKQGNYAITVPW